MSNKRFECDSQDVQFSIVADGELILVNPSYVVNLLNSLQEENEQLRQFINKGRRLSVKELMDNINENELLKKKIRRLEKENRELNSIKKFAERNGINIFLIEEAFRKCWKDNGKLFVENEQLRKELDCIKKTNKSWGHNVECDYEWYEGIDKEGV